MFSDCSFLQDSYPHHHFFSNLIGEFTLGTCHYLILLVSEDDAMTDFKKAFKKVHQFEIEGQTCVIVEATGKQLLAQASPADLLTARELQIAALVALGRGNKQIARQLDISEWTVATYIRRIFDKLKVDTRASMVYRCASLISTFIKLNLGL